MLISEALGHLLRIPLTEAKKLHLIVLASTIKLFPPIIYTPRYFILSKPKPKEFLTNKE